MIKPKKYIQETKGYDTPLFPTEYKLKLDLNENLIGPSPKVIEILKNINENDIKFYPVYGELVEKIAKFNNVDKSSVLPTCGADEAINYVFDTFIEPEDEVLTVSPTFTMPQVYATATGCVYKEVPYQEKWVFPIDDFLAEINSKTKMVIITTPNSPTAECISEENLLKIIERAKDCVILIDETYANYADKSYSYLIKDNDNVIITKSMSKDFAIAGLRLGYIISTPTNIEYIRRIISPFSVNVLAAKAGVASIDDFQHFENVKAEIEQSKTLLTEGLKGIAKKVYPSKTNFLCVDMGEKAEFIYNKLLNNGIKVKMFNDKFSLKNHYRISVPSVKSSRFFLEALKPREMIVFDMDGVLIDTSNSYRTAIKGTFEYFSKKEISFDKIQEAKNLGGLNNDWDLTEYLLKQENIEVKKEEIIEKFQELYFGENGEGFISNETLLLPQETIQKLAKQYDLAIFTGRPKSEAIYSLNLFGIKEYFSIVLTMDDVPDGYHKPNPMGLKLINKIATPTKTYYLGDTSDDMLCAQEAGISAVGVLPPQDKSSTLKDRLHTQGAMVVLNNTEEIVGYIGASEYAQQ